MSAPVVGNGTDCNGTPRCFATSSRASPKRPLAVSQRTDSGTKAQTRNPKIAGAMPSAARPRQPSIVNNAADVTEASNVPALANTM